MSYQNLMLEKITVNPDRVIGAKEALKLYKKSRSAYLAPYPFAKGGPVWEFVTNPDSDNDFDVHFVKKKQKDKENQDALVELFAYHMAKCNGDTVVQRIQKVGKAIKDISKAKYFR